jgi:hypothetical protein
MAGLSQAEFTAQASNDGKPVQVLLSFNWTR